MYIHVYVVNWWVELEAQDRLPKQTNKKYINIYMASFTVDEYILLGMPQKKTRRKLIDLKKDLCIV